MATLNPVAWLLGLSLIANAVLGALYGFSGRGAAQNVVNAATCEAVNAGSDDAVSALQGRLDVFLSEQRSSAEKQRAAEAERERLEQALNKAERAERSARDDLYSTDPDCGLLARVRVCAAIAGRLRAFAEEAAGADARR